MFYLEIFQTLHRAQARYLVAGGVALNLHGVPRMTADLDLAVALDEENLAAVLGALGALGMVPALPVSAQGLLDPATRRRWKDEKNLLAFPFHHPARPFEAIDLLVNLDLDFDGLWGRRHQVQVAGTPVPVMAIDDLIDLKRAAGRPQDLADVEALARVVRRQRADL